MAKKIYKEKQRFNSIEVTLFIVFFMLMTLVKLIRDISTHDTSQVEGLVCISLLALGALVLRMLYQSELKLCITDEYIKFKMTPWHANTQKIAWQDIESCEVVRTSNYAQWHGGNIAFGHQKNFSFSGKNGLHFITNDGTSYFIGSRNLDALELAATTAFQEAQAKPKYYHYTPSATSILLRPV